MTDIQFKFTFDDYVRAQRLHGNRNLIVVSLVGIIFLLASGALFRLGNGGSGSAMAGAGVILVFYPWLIRLNWKYCYKRTRSNDGECTFTFTDEHIHTRSSNARSDVEWSAVRRVAEDKHIFLLYLAPAKFFPIPKRACTPEQIEELRQLFANRVSSRT